MKLARYSLSTTTALLLGTTTVIGPGAVQAYAETDIPLPIAHFSRIAVDAPHGHLFISGGAGTDGIVVTDLDGQNPAMISGEPGATGLALSENGAVLYAALPDQDAIAAIDTKSLTESARYATGAGTRPDSLAVAGGTLWFGYGTADAGGIGSVDAAGTVELGRDPDSWAGRPALATTPAPSGVLAAAVQAGDATDIVTYRAEGGALTRQAAKTLPAFALDDFAVTADGQHLALSSWQNGSDYRYRTADLSVDGRFAMTLAAKAVAVAPDGTLAGCNCNDFEFMAFPETGEGYYSDHGFAAGTRLSAHGLAWAPDESRLYGVAVDASGGSPRLRIVGTPETAWVMLNALETSPLAPNEAYSFDVGFNSPLSLDPGVSLMPGTVRITRYDDADPDGTLIADATTTRANVANFFGAYHVKGTAPLSGPLSFHVDYSGAVPYAPAERTFDIREVRAHRDAVRAVFQRPWKADRHERAAHLAARARGDRCRPRRQDRPGPPGGAVPGHRARLRGRRLRRPRHTSGR